MSINCTKLAQVVAPGESKQNFNIQAKERNATPSPAPGNISADAKVQLSSLTKKIQSDDSQDIDHERLAKIQSAIASDTLEFDYDKIASALINNTLQFNK